MTQASLPPRPQEEVLILRPSRGWSALNLGDLWRYRELVYFLTWRDVMVRYKQTALGIAWAVIQPFFTMVVFTIFFGRLAKVPTENVPAPIFFYTGLLPWGLFTKAITDAGRSMVQNRSMITKVYFPRLVIPIASVLGGLVDFLVAFVVLVGMIIYYNAVPTQNPSAVNPPAALTTPAASESIAASIPTAERALLATAQSAEATAQSAQSTAQSARATAQAIRTSTQGGEVHTQGDTFRFKLTVNTWALPFLLLLAIVTALGTGLWLSALNVTYRDINYILPFLTQFWLFITPIAYPASLIPERWQLLYALNPMTGVVEGFRWALLGAGTPPGPMLAVSSLIALAVLVSGLFYFRRMERTFADMV